MNFRSSSYSNSRPPPERHASVSSRLSSAVSAAEEGDGSSGAGGAAAAHQITEEIAKLKRYEDFTTIDWVQDAARDQLRRKARRKRMEGLYSAGHVNWRDRLWDSYEAAQGWLVITLVGIAIGLNAAFLSIAAEWLSDIKMGYCTTAFYLNEDFCCWGEDNGCAEWHRWTGFEPFNYIIYIILAGLFAWVAATLVRCYAPYAAGSGISEIKVIIAGFVMKGFLGFWVFLIKSLSLPFVIASGLSVGKEGPSVHYAVAAGNVISRMFEKYRLSASKTREILCASAAAGVAVAFGSPIGGVLFSLEEMSSHFPLKTLWRSYFCALVATAVLAAMNPFRTGQLVMFQVHYDRSWHFFELFFFVIVGIFGGLYGAFVMKWNMRAVAFRKKYLMQYGILEATLLAVGTAVICYPNAFLRIDMTESMSILFLECEGAEDFHGLCEADHRFGNWLSLALATVIRTFLVIISYGSKVPAGIFVPSMAIGAYFGRSVGIIVQALYDANPQSAFFAACQPDVPCITPGTYAFLGAAAALSGIMHITVSVVVIMFELTGALTYILPTMIVVGTTKIVSELFGKGGIADRMIWFNGFPFLDNKEEHNFGVPVSRAMIAKVVAIPATGMSLRAIEALLEQDRYQGFPIVEDMQSKLLVGYIGSTELRYAVDKVKKQPGGAAPDTKCTFTHAARSSSIASSAAEADLPSTSASAAAAAAAAHHGTFDFSPYVDTTPVTVHPRLPLETVMELFRKLGPRVILIEYHGRLSGMVTVKDCLRYQFKAEAADHAGSQPQDDGMAEVQERVWHFMQRVGGWVSGKVSTVSGGRIRLSGSFDGGSRPAGGGGQILDGTEDVGEELGGVELESRR